MGQLLLILYNTKLRSKLCIDLNMGTLPLLPPGYRFAPTDEELMRFYLRNKAFLKPTPAAAVSEINSDDLYSRPPYAIGTYNIVIHLYSCY